MAERGQRTTLRFGAITAEVSLLKSSGKAKDAEHETRRVLVEPKVGDVSADVAARQADTYATLTGAQRVETDAMGEPLPSHDEVLMHEAHEGKAVASSAIDPGGLATHAVDPDGGLATSAVDPAAGATHAGSYPAGVPDAVSVAEETQGAIVAPGGVLPAGTDLAGDAPVPAVPADVPPAQTQPGPVMPPEPPRDALGIAHAEPDVTAGELAARVQSEPPRSTSPRPRRCSRASTRTTARG